MPAIETKIWLALKNSVEALGLSLPIAWPSEKFTAVTSGYVRVGHVSAAPNPELIAAGKKHTRRGFLMLTLVMPMNQNSVVFIEMAASIASQFKEGANVRYNDLCATITSAPHVMDGYEDGGYWNVPVRIPWRTFA